MGKTTDARFNSQLRNVLFCFGKIPTNRSDEMVSAAQSTLMKQAPSKEPRIETTGGVADTLRPVIDASFGASIPLDFEFWDGSKLTSAESSAVCGWADASSTTCAR